MADKVFLHMDTPEVQYLCQKDKRLAKLITMVGDISYTPRHENSYSFMVHEIIEQMLSIKVGQKIFDRLESLCDGEVTPDSISSLTDAQIRGTGTSNAKVEYIRNVTKATYDGLLDYLYLKTLTDDEIIRVLTGIRGIGTWTAKMYLIFVLDRPDVLPFEDGAFLQVYRWLYHTEDCSKQAVFKHCQKWSPYSSIASRYFYKALDNDITKQTFHLYK